MRSILRPKTVIAALCFLAVGIPTRAQTATSHRVLAGQTLWSIAYGYGTSVETLMQLNGITDPGELRAGQLLLLPGSARPAPRPAKKAKQQIDWTPTWPVHGQLTSKYGWRRGSRHAGIDIAAPKGTIITAAAAGRVARAGVPWGRYGRVILLEHAGGYTTLYAHLSGCYVREGQNIERGEAIASVGQSGNATGPHLHFEIWHGEETQDPMRHLGERTP